MIEPSHTVDIKIVGEWPSERKKKYTKYGIRRVRKRNPRKNGESFSGIFSEKMKDSPADKLKFFSDHDTI